MDENCNVVTCEEGIAICFEGFPGDHVLIVDISLEEGAYFVEGSSVDEFCNVVNEQKIINQPVEVRVRSGGLVFLLGKTPGVKKAIFKYSFSRRFPCPTAH